MQVTLDWQPLPHQVPLLAWQPDRSLPPGGSTVAALGGYGAGKSRACAMAFALAVLRQGHWDGYGKLNPIATVIGPNLTHARERQLRIIDALLPPELVKKRWGLPAPKILLANGVEIQALSAEATIEGADWCCCWIDEIDKPEFTDHPQRLINFQARFRGPLRDRHPILFISGLPTSGYVRDQFDKPNDGKTQLFRWATRLNTHNGPGYLDQIKSKVPSGDELTFLEGEWQQIPNALFPQFSEDKHLVVEPENRALPVDIALDVGNRSSLIVGQRLVVRGTTETRLHIVDEVIGAGLSAEEQIAEFRTRGWFVQPSKSTISVDPTVRRDELREVYSAFPGVHVVQRKRDDHLHDVNRGIRLVQAALRNAKGQVRLTFEKRLAKNRYGVIDAMTRLRFNDRSGAPQVSDLYDHGADATRYLACTVLGPQLAPLVIT